MTNEGTQAKALKGMLNRVLDSKDSSNYNYEGYFLNLNQYGLIANMIENNWIRLLNWNDYLVRETLLAILYLFFW